MSVIAGVAGACERVVRLLDVRASGRVVVGIAGPPGAGKSTFAEQLVQALNVDAALLPMDAFHLSNRELERLGRSARKGAMDTFDVAGYLATLDRARGGDDVYVPLFERSIEEPVAASVLVPASARVIITEGNYLLHDAAPWAHVRSRLDEAWYLELGDAERRRRLVARHHRYGKTLTQAEAWVAEVDEANADVIARSRARAEAIAQWVD